MLYQLKTGRTIEISIDQYLDMTDEELQDLEGLPNYNTIEVNNPFYNSYRQNIKKELEDLTDEKELGKIDEKVRRQDKYFQNPDDE